MLKRGNDCVPCFFAKAHVPVLCLTPVPRSATFAFVFLSFSHSSVTPFFLYLSGWNHTPLDALVRWKILDHNAVQKPSLSQSYFGSRLWVYRRTPTICLFTGTHRQKLQILTMNRGLLWAGMWTVLLLPAVIRPKNKRCSPGHPGTRLEHWVSSRRRLPCTSLPSALPSSLHTPPSMEFALFCRHATPKRTVSFWDWIASFLHPKQLDVISQNVGIISTLYPNNWLEAFKAGGEKGGRRERSGGRRQRLPVFVSLPSGWKPEGKIEETHPLSTDLTVIPCSHSAKSKWNAFRHSCPSLKRLLRKLSLPVPSGSRISMQHFCFQGHSKINSSTFSAIVCHC